MSSQLLRFAVVGAAGFVVDSGVLYGALAVGLGPGTGRLLSFLSAAFFTWQLNRRFTFSTTHTSQGLWHEWLRYLTAMAGGGLVNLLIYAWVMAAARPHPLVPLLAVAFGSIAGLAFNFASAKWWVYRVTAAAKVPWWERWTARLSPRDIALAAMVQMVFWSAHLRLAELPGLYMDAVNPDYLAAQMLERGLNNPAFAIPSAFGPILGGLYHGVFNVWAGLPVYAVLGFSLLALRVAHGLVAGTILVLTQAVVQRISGSRTIAVMTALALATELAYIASWRTQNYIVLSGCLWLLAALWLALRPVPGRHHLLLSGLSMGLAVYCYFVFLFFVPAWLWMGWRNSRFSHDSRLQGRWRPLAWWLGGFVLGMQTYVLGYVSLVIKLKGPAGALTWLQQMLGALSPMASQTEGLQVLAHLWQSARWAAANWSNEMLMLGAPISGGWTHVKFGLFVTCIAVLTLLALLSRQMKVYTPVADIHGVAVPAPAPAFAGASQLAWLPLSFWACAMVFGTRLGAHHYASWLPLLYVLTAVGAAALCRMLPPVWRWAPAVALALMSLLNLQQQTPFFDRLAATGGTGRFTNAINRLADDALHLPPQVVHVFPDWGFMMPFNFLTGNQRPYVIDLSDFTLGQLRQQRSPLRVVYWNEADGATHRAKLEAAGYEVTQVAPYLRRDQAPAFWLMQARLP